MTDNNLVHSLGVFIHGMLTTLHTIGIAYGIRKRNYGDVLAHTAATLFSLQAAAHHVKECKK